MMVTADEARGVARAFARTRASLAWSETSVEVTATDFAGRASWAVASEAAVDPATPWTELPRSPARMTYFIARDDGSCLGFAGERSRTVLPKPWSPAAG